MIASYAPSSLRAWLKKFYGDVPLSLTPFVYTASLGTISAAATKSANIQIQANTDFVLCGINLSTSNGSTNAGLAQIQLSDGATGAQLFSAPGWGGNFLYPSSVATLCYPKFLAGNSSMLGTVTAPSQLNSAYLSLVGVNVRAFN